MTLPNFLIIGAAKCGTTSLYRYLEQHPEIYMSRNKEPKFFALEGADLDSFTGPGDASWLKNQTITDLGNYETLFEGVKDEKAIGEASTIYLYSPNCPQTIKHYIPDAKLIVLLRQPIQQAFSMFLHHLRSGFYQEYLAENEPSYLEQHFAEDFLKSDELDDTWLYHWHYKQMGAYYSQLKRYLDVFERHQIKVFLFQDLKQNPTQLLRETFEFLGVDSDFVPPNLTKKYNAHKDLNQKPKNKAVHQFLMRPNPVKSLLKPLFPQKLRGKVNFWLRQRNMETTQQPLSVKLSPETRQKLTEVHREDILKLQDLIQRDLSHWFN
ncbi:sulfotransferase [Geitlerinema sp. P-1104]|uniref:sulfotransferase domain-containing protein n=1 Tax=Geitlerinema sp. P-1104 TaxID=2546230 RepID=UPI001476ECA6|nr:sulfotransferase domain-containing protein [Geitlerinema sp. P-1104]NMG60155.1 sulfotransferase [Geitlerinema sp. P-1104]